MLITKIEKFKTSCNDQESMYKQIKNVDPSVSDTPFGKEIDKLMKEKESILNKIDQ